MRKTLLARARATAADMFAPIEKLESRRLMAADPAALAAAGFEPMQWQGQTAYAKPNQWIASLDGLAGSAAKQIDGVNGALNKAAVAGLKAVKHLGEKGLVLLQSSGKNF